MGSITIVLGWWLVPAFVTLASFAVAFIKTPKPEPSSYFPDFSPILIGGALFGVATILSLLAWLLWSLFA